VTDIKLVREGCGRSYIPLVVLRAPVCIEVYPHPAMVGLFGLAELIIYKSGPSRAEGFAQLVRHFASIGELC
jgi:predicted RNase H-like nuclease